MKKRSKTIGLLFLLTLIKRVNGFISHAQFNNMIHDCVGLMSVPPSRLQQNIKNMETLEPIGVSVKYREQKGKQFFTIKSHNHSLSQLCKISEKNAPGFHAAALTQHKITNGVVSPSPHSINIAFGGTITLFDIPRTLSIHVGQQQHIDEKLLKEFMEQCITNFQKEYPRSTHLQRFSITAHSAGAQTALRFAEMIKEKLPRAYVTIALYEPFGARFLKYNSKNSFQTISYFNGKSFLNKLPIEDGKAVGKEVILPESSHIPPTDPINAHRIFPLFKNGIALRKEIKRQKTQEVLYKNGLLKTDKNNGPNIR